MPVTLFTKGEANGWRRWHRPGAMPSASIGPPIWPMHVHLWVTGLHYRAISIPLSFMHPVTHSRRWQGAASYGKGSGHIFNLGHGIHPDVDLVAHWRW